MPLQPERLTATMLALFNDGLTWPEIHSLTYGRRSKWWREVVGIAEDDDFLHWIPGPRGKRGRWFLTDKGRELVRASAVGTA